MTWTNPGDILDGADVLNVLVGKRKAPTSSYEAFQEWWGKEVQRAAADNVTLIVLESKRCTGISRRYKWLKRMEEDEWDGPNTSGERLRFTTRKNIRQAISKKHLIKDTWGEYIEK